MTEEAKRHAAAGVRTLALDVPGCGAYRGEQTDGLSYDDVARRLANDIRQAGLRDVTLVGHSQAGQAIAVLLRLFPDLVRRVVHVACSMPSNGQSVLQMMGRGPRGIDPDAVGWPGGETIGDVVGRSAALFCNDMTLCQRADFLAQLGGDMWPSSTYRESRWSCGHLAAVPTTYVVCLADALLPIEWQKTFADRLHARQRIYLDAGHQAMITRPVALAKILLKG